jgi:hypothetical protein
MMKSVAEIADPIFYDRADVFAAAVAAQRINGEYVKRTVSSPYGFRRSRYPVCYPNKPQIDPNSTKLPNGSMVKIMLAADRSDITPEDYERGEEIRAYFCSMITLVFSGDAKDFIKAAVEAATEEQIPEAGKMIMLIASLPSVYERNIKRNKEREELSTLTQNSIPLTESIGTNVKLKITVIDSIFKERFGSYAVNAFVNNIPGNRMIFFFDRTNFKKGETYNISGRVKSKGNQTTQLHYVRDVTPKGEDKEILW